MRHDDYIPDGAERRFHPGLVTRAEGSEEGKIVIRGVAAVFNDLSEDLGGFREKIDPGAFDEVLEDDVRALFNHDRNIVLGRTAAGTLRLKVTKRGLEYEYDSPDTQAARDLALLVERGDINQSSFAFYIDKQEWDEPDAPGQPAIRTIMKVRRLIDVSPVTYPGYANTAVAKRSMDEWRQESDGGLALRRRRLDLIENHADHY